MAEVLGVVASGIAVVDAAGQVGSGIIKLRRLWNEVNNVPDTIKSLMQQLELLAVIMGEMEVMHQSNTRDATLRPFSSQGMELSMMRCREAMETLEDLVTKLTKHVDSQKRLKRAKAKLKVALGKDDLNQCQGRLSDVVQLLQLAQSCYQTSLNGAMLQHLIALPTHLESRSQVKIMAIESSTAQSESGPEMREINSSRADEISDADAKSPAIFRQQASWMQSWDTARQSLGPFASYAWYSSETKDYEDGFIRKNLRFRFELAQWLSGKSWEIQVSRSISGWHHHIRTYNIVPYNSEVIRCARLGDLDRIKYLFTNNLASIHDRDVEDCSLLFWAVNSQDWWDDDNYESAYELATFLHKCGLDMAETTTPHYFSTLEIFLLYPNWEPYLPSLSNYWQSSKAADDFDELALTKPTVPTATIRFTDFPRFSAFQPTIQPNFYGITLTERVYTWLIYDIVDPKSFRKIVRGNESITRNDAVELAESHINLLGLAVRSFVQSRFIPWYNQSTWNELMHELVLTIGDVSLVQEDYIHYDIFENQHQMSYGNPLMVCIFSAVYTFFYAEFKSRKRSFERHLHTEVMKWLQILQDCSINLESYGQHEHGMIFRKDNRRRLLGYHEVWVWTGFSLGPNPSDWVFHLDRVVERFSGDFWRLIDNPVQHVPGAWDDTDREFFVTYRGEVLYRDIFKSELEDDSEDD